MLENEASSVRLLLVEDSEDDAQLILRSLQSMGSIVHHRRVETEAEFSAALIESKWSVVISDFSLPHFDGFSALKVCRRLDDNIPFILVSGTISDVDAVAAMRGGAHDYIFKNNLSRLGAVVKREISEADSRLRLKRAEEERERTRVQLQQASRLAALGEMAGSIAHEINNPMAIIAGKARQLSEHLERPSLDITALKRFAAALEETSYRVVKIVNGMRTLTRQAEGDPFLPSSIATIVEGTVAICNSQFKYGCIKLEVHAPAGDVTLECRATQIAQVILNLLNNALDAVGSLAEKWVRLDIRDLDSEIEISVTDSGNGIPMDVRGKILEPFFTTKEVGKGTGLGLSIAKSIVAEHRGELTLDALSPNTRFVIRLPKAHEPSD